MLWLFISVTLTDWLLTHGGQLKKDSQRNKHSVNDKVKVYDVSYAGNRQKYLLVFICKSLTPRSE